MIRELIFSATRTVGRMLPLPVLISLLYPLAVARAGLESMVWRGRRPPRRLPPVGGGATRRVELRERSSAWLNTAALLWADRFNRPPWSERIETTDLDRLRELGAHRPVIIVTLHFGGIFVLPSILRANGIPTAAVVGDKLWPVRWWRERRAELTQIERLPAHLRSGDARAVIRYLQPGRCLLVALDYPLGDQIATRFDGSLVHLSTPALRLARIAHAVVLPMLVRVDGPWRYHVVIAQPVPDAVLATKDDAAALAHVVGELMPVAAARPEQALPLLVRAFQADNNVR